MSQHCKLLPTLPCSSACVTLRGVFLWSILLDMFNWPCGWEAWRLQSQRCQLPWEGVVGCPGAIGREARSACCVWPPSLKLLAHPGFFGCPRLYVKWMDSGIAGEQIKYNFEMCLGFLKKLSIWISMTMSKGSASPTWVGNPLNAQWERQKMSDLSS